MSGMTLDVSYINTSKCINNNIERRFLFIVYVYFVLHTMLIN